MGKYKDKIKRAIGAMKGDATATSELSVKVIKRDGTVKDYGVVAKHKCVTSAGLAQVVLLMAGLDATTGASFRFHQAGTGEAAESSSDTTLGTPYYLRVYGSQMVGSSGNIYRSAANIAAQGAVTLTEHGVFSALTGGTLLDRTLLNPTIELAAGEIAHFDYSLTFNAGG